MNHGISRRLSFLICKMDLMGSGLMGSLGEMGWVQGLAQPSVHSGSVQEMLLGGAGESGSPVEEMESSVETDSQLGGAEVSWGR